MKYIITTLLLASLLFSSCTTTSTGKKTIDPNTADKIAPILAASAASAVVYAYNRDPNSALYIAAVRSFLFEFLESTNLNATELQSKLSDLPIKELKTEVAQLIIAPVIASYKSFGEQLARNGYNNHEGLRLLVRALIDGVGVGLQTIGKSQKELPAMYPGQPIIIYTNHPILTNFVPNPNVNTYLSQ